MIVNYIVYITIITKSFPTKSPRVELSGRLPIKFRGHENSHPLELRVRDIINVYIYIYIYIYT